MQKESERVRQFGQLSDHFAPKRQPLLFSAFIPRITSTKGDLPVYSAETYLTGYAVKQKKKRKRKSDTESGKGEKERFSQSVPCSRIMARTHCSNYLCIRLTPLSAEPAGRGTCVTNMRACPPTHWHIHERTHVHVCERRNE